MSMIRNGALASLACLMLAVAPTTAHAQAEELGMMQRFVDLMQGYFNIIEMTHSVADEPEKSAILHMQKIKEIMEERGQAARAADVFHEVLKTSENPTIRSAASVLLAETLKETGRSDEATQVLLQGLKESVANAQP